MPGQCRTGQVHFNSVNLSLSYPLLINSVNYAENRRYRPSRPLIAAQTGWADENARVSGWNLGWAA